MPHDFKKFPELTNQQMDFYYFQSPHRQITEDFRAKVIDVHDGDTIKVRWKERNFDFPIRFLYTSAPELDEFRGIEARNWLRDKLMGQEVDIMINQKNRVEKWGRLLGVIMHKGISMNEEIVREGKALSWEERNQGKIPTIIELFGGEE